MHDLTLSLTILDCESFKHVDFISLFVILIVICGTHVIIIMYIYHALINALSIHMININLNMIFYTHAEHSPTKTIYIKYYKKKNKTKTRTHYKHTHTDCSRNWVLILVRMEILREEEGFQFGFKR